MAIAIALAISPVLAAAAGMVPETSVVIINEADGEGTMNVKNTDEKAALLYVNVNNIPEDEEPLLLVTPPVSRVEGGEMQLVRFILQGKEALKIQRLKRATFEGIPQKDPEDDRVKVTLTVVQDLPVIIHPKGLAQNQEPWKLLSWEVSDGKLVVSNKSPYVVRLTEVATALPQRKDVKLPRSYILPGERIVAADQFDAANVSGIRIYPATVYGYQVDSYDAPLAK